MKPFRSTTRAAGNMTILFLLAAAVSVLVLVWMGVRLVQQDRALEESRLEEHREAAADRIVAFLERTLVAEEKGLEDAQAGDLPAPSDDAFIMVEDPSGTRIRPEKALLYYPEILKGREARPELYADAEKAEFADQDYNKASLSRYNTDEDVDKIIEVFPGIVASLRRLSPYWDNERNEPRPPIPAE